MARQTANFVGGAFTMKCDTKYKSKEVLNWKEKIALS